MEQQAGDTSDAPALLPQVSVSLCRVDALWEAQQDWKQHLGEAQHTVRHRLWPQRLLKAAKAKVRHLALKTNTE